MFAEIKEACDVSETWNKCLLELGVNLELGNSL